jgi:hypothetical protein
MPNMSIVPKKYHTFISSPLRRVFLENDASRALIDDLNAENKRLHTHVASLKRDKNLLMDRCEAAQSAASKLTANERAARLAREKAKEEARLAKLNLERLRVEYDALKSRCVCPLAQVRQAESDAVYFKAVLEVKVRRWQRQR